MREIFPDSEVDLNLDTEKVYSFYCVFTCCYTINRNEINRTLSQKTTMYSSRFFSFYFSLIGSIGFM